MPVARLSAAAVIGLCALAAACGGTEANSPTAPSGIFGARAGAVITGRVSGVPVTATATGTTARPMAVTRVEVTIVGTDIQTTVDGQGNFELTGVPPGDVTLKFSGSGINATITLTGVTLDDRIHIVVALNGNGARLEKEDRDHDDDDDEDEDRDEIKGVVSGLEGSCPAIRFTLAGVRVQTTPATEFEIACGRIANGTRVEVEGTTQADGTLLAREVEIDD